MKKKWKILSVLALLMGTVSTATITTRATDDYEENMENVVWEDDTSDEDMMILSGKCGDSLYYTLDRETGILSFEGEGDSYDYQTYAELPWAKYYDAITQTIMPEGVKLKLWMMDYEYAERAGRLGDMAALFVPTANDIEEWMNVENLTDQDLMDESAPLYVTDDNGDTWYAGTTEDEETADDTVTAGSGTNHKYSTSYSSNYYATGRNNAFSSDDSGNGFLTGTSSGNNTSSSYNRYNTGTTSSQYKDTLTDKTDSDQEKDTITGNSKNPVTSDEKDGYTFEKETDETPEDTDDQIEKTDSTITGSEDAAAPAIKDTKENDAGDDADLQETENEADADEEAAGDHSASAANEAETERGDES